MRVFDLILKYINMITIVDVVDILIVAFVIYRLILLIKETRAQTLVKGILLLIVVMQISGWIGFNTINYLLQNVMQLSIFALLVVFQPEIRRALEMVGRSRITSSDWFNFDVAVSDAKINYTIEQVCQAAHIMAAAKTGALIVIERETKIGEIISTGTVIDAQISAELIRNIFYPKSPLHDGAVVVRDNRISAAGCFLPLSQQQDGLSKELGTRHRAALGMSECSDAAVVVVSEETGKISVASNGSLIRNLTSKSLYSILFKALGREGEEEKKQWFWPWGGKGK